jgi:hypothetical protein
MGFERIFRIATLTSRQMLGEFITLSHGVPEFNGLQLPEF